MYCYLNCLWIKFICKIVLEFFCDPTKIDLFPSVIDVKVIIWVRQFKNILSVIRIKFCILFQFDLHILVDEIIEKRSFFLAILKLLLFFIVWRTIWYKRGPRYEAFLCPTEFWHLGVLKRLVLFLMAYSLSLYSQIYTNKIIVRNNEHQFFISSS